jgi:hypothetical protein
VTGALALLLAAALAQTAAPAKAAPTKAAKPSAEPVASSFAVSFGGGVAALPLEWQTPASWTLYAETASLVAAQRASLGPALEAGLWFRFSRRFGVTIAFGWSKRDGSADVAASLPHPLYLDRPRRVSGRAEGLAYRELAGHFDVEWRPVTGRFELSLFAGPSFVRVDADLVESVTAVEAYPYDEAAFASASVAPSRSAASLGWNAGAAGAWAVAPRLDLGLQLRYLAAKPELDNVTLEAGGLDVTAFLRLRF